MRSGKARKAREGDGQKGRKAVGVRIGKTRQLEANWVSKEACWACEP